MSSEVMKIHGDRLITLEGEMKEVREKQSADYMRFDAMNARMEHIEVDVKELREEVARQGKIIVGIAAAVGVDEDGHYIEEPTANAPTVLSPDLQAPTSGPAYYLAIFLEYGGKEAVRWVGIGTVMVTVFWAAKQFGLV